jgi:hypothetical protein
LVLLYVSSFSDSIIPVRDRPAASAIAQASVPAAETGTRTVRSLALATLAPSPDQLVATPAQAGTDGHEVAVRPDLSRAPASPGEAEQADSIQARTADAGACAGGDASRPTEAAAAPLTAPVGPKVPGGQRDMRHRRVGGALVGPYVTRSSRGTWLFPPNSNGGANS